MTHFLLGLYTGLNVWVAWSYWSDAEFHAREGTTTASRITNVVCALLVGVVLAGVVWFAIACLDIAHRVSESRR